MINFSGIKNKSLVGKLLRLPLHLLPRNLTVRIVQGKLRGKKWIAGSSNHGCWLGSYEAEKQRLMTQIVKPATVFLDIGANVGFYTLLAATLVGKSGKVFAFEPLPRNIRFLERHLKMNAVHNATVLRAAVSDRTGAATFQKGKSHSMGHLTDRSDEDGIAVELVSLDDLIFKGILPLPDYMKIDVEGAELSVLKGAQHLLTAGRPTIFLATHGSEVHSQCLSLLRSLGYDCQPVDASKDITSCDELVAAKDARE
jgi:FkbM family methyltransferase